jgi:antirestriction protein
MSKPPNDTPRIYVASLSDYNEGRLEGKWIDIPADMTVEELREEIHAMLALCSTETHTAEEFAIHDHEGFMGCTVSEYENLETVVKLGAFVAEHGALGAAVLQIERDIDQAVECLRERQAGSGDSLSDWASSYLEETGALTEVPERWQSYIDFERYARDLEQGGEIETVQLDGTVHVFWTR